MIARLAGRARARGASTPERLSLRPPGPHMPWLLPRIDLYLCTLASHGVYVLRFLYVIIRTRQSIHDLYTYIPRLIYSSYI